VPIVIAHRGASGYRPEHTLAAYELAARMGADYIEPDLVSTRDGVLVARHENEISGTTDVASRPEFAPRRRTQEVGGREVTGWFTEDFTLAELQTLRATERIPDLRRRNTLYDRRYAVPTFDEILDLRERLSDELGRAIGVYPETKHPSHFGSIGLALEEPLVDLLRRRGLHRRDAPVFVQSFEVANLRALREQIDAPLIQLLGAPDRRPFDDARRYRDLATADGLRGIATYADGVGPLKTYLVPWDDGGRSVDPTSFVADAHAAGLAVHPWTFRNENAFLPAELRSSDDPADYGDAFAEYEAFSLRNVHGWTARPAA
jgi:glycerophosphoryl diester phosphodiesterase